MITAGRLNSAPWGAILRCCLLAVASLPCHLAAQLPNPLVNNPAADGTSLNTQNRTSLILGPGTTILSAFSDSGSSFGGAKHFTGFARSTDGGDNWTDQGVLPNTINGDSAYPSLARSAITGTILLSTGDFNTLSTLPIFRSITDGSSYPSVLDGAGGTGTHDLAVLAADNFAGSGQGHFYLFWRNFGAGGGMTLNRSIDDGLSFPGPRVVLTTASGQGAAVVVGADHSVYCFWLAASPHRILMRKSVDRGLSFGAEVTVATLRTTGLNGDLGLGGGFRTNSFPRVVANPSDPQQLYVIFNDHNLDGADKANIYLAKTADGGAAWSAPVQINTNTGLTDQWHPVVAIAPDGGAIFVSWYDRRLDPNNSLIDVFARHGEISGTTLTFGADYRITGGSFPVVVGQDPVVHVKDMGDYDGAAADNAMFYRTWSDNRLLRSGSHQPDVRFVKIPRAGPGPILTAAGASAAVAENCAPANGALDPGETVTVNFAVINVGATATGDVLGTLQATGGIANPSVPQSFGVIPLGGTVVRPFTFQVTGTCGGATTASLELHDPTTSFGTLAYSLPSGVAGSPVVFSNLGSIVLNDDANATPYPSPITVSGITNAIHHVTVRLNGLTHTFPSDIDILLVGPGGQGSMVLSEGGGSVDVSAINPTFDDNAASGAPVPLGSGTYRPTDLQPGDTQGVSGEPFMASFAVFGKLTGAAVNGVWNLYARDDSPDDFGSLSSGWTLTVVPASCSTSCGVVPPPALNFYTLSPCRVVDTDRPADAPALQAGVQRDFLFAAPSSAAVCGIPLAAKAVALNVTVVANSAGNVNLFPQGLPQPAAQTIHFRANTARANNVVVGLSPFDTGKLSALLSNGSARFIIDVTGYFID